MNAYEKHTIDLDNGRRVEIAYSTRAAGPMNAVAQEDYFSPVEGPHKAGNNERRANRAQFFKDALRLTDTMVAIPKLEHGARVLYTSQHNDHFEDLKGDGLVTEAFGLGLGVFAADCAAVVLAAPIGEKNAVLCVLHAGWRGIAAGIIENGIALMRRMGARTSEIQGWIGPAVQSCCYEVGPDTLSALFPGQTFLGHKFISLPDIIAERAFAAGIKGEKNIIVDECTKCELDLGRRHVYYSRRREGSADPTNNHMTVAVIR